MGSAEISDDSGGARLPPRDLEKWRYGNSALLDTHQPRESGTLHAARVPPVALRDVQNLQNTVKAKE